ncbi:MAG: hypothetical protein J6Q82_02195 [Clostridia bacterium]|nr:hypothetical protein [Clostridia bacterium]
MKILKRILCLTLVVLMLLPLLVACKSNKKKEDGENTKDRALLEAEMPDDGVGMLPDGGFGGREIRFLGWTGASANEWEVAEGDTGTTLKSAIYARNEAVKGRLDVKLKWQYIEGHAGFEFTYAATAGQQAGNGLVDVFTPYSRAACVLMMNGATRDMQGIKYLDLTDEWWNSAMIDCAVNGKIYFAGGDMVWTLMGNTIAFCYNKDILEKNASILEKYGVTTMYDLVNEGKWTLDTMIEMAKAVAADKTYGFTGYLVPMDAFYKAMDLKWMEIDATGQQTISEDQHSGKVDVALGKLLNFFRTSASDAYNFYATNLEYASNNGNKSNPKMPSWQNGQTLFILNAIVSITDYKFTELAFDFGVLPMPMYDTAQFKGPGVAGQGYKTTPDFEYSVVSIPRTATGLDQIGAVLQVMASEGFTRTSPAYFSEVLKKQISDSPEDYAMWETIRGSIDLDPGRMFDNSAGDADAGYSCMMFRYCIQMDLTTTAETWASSGEKRKQHVRDMNANMALIEAKYD